MTEHELEILIIQVIQAGLAVQGISGCVVVQNFQVTEQGAEPGPAIYFTKISDTPYGWMQRKYTSLTGTKTLSVSEAMQGSERQAYLTTFQVNALTIDDPALTTALIAADYLWAASFALQSQAGLALIRAAGAEILRISASRQTHFKDERGRNEADPSFDFTLKHARTLQTQVPSTSEVVGNLAAYDVQYRSK